MPKMLPGAVGPAPNKMPNPMQHIFWGLSDGKVEAVRSPLKNITSHMQPFHQPRCLLTRSVWCSRVSLSNLQFVASLDPTRKLIGV